MSNNIVLSNFEKQNKNILTTVKQWYEYKKGIECYCLYAKGNKKHHYKTYDEFVQANSQLESSVMDRVEVRLGEVGNSYLVVLDIDGSKKGDPKRNKIDYDAKKTINELLKLCEKEEKRFFNYTKQDCTLYLATPSGGFHYYFFSKTPLLNEKIKLGDHVVELKCVKQHITIPNSKKDNKVYGESPYNTDVCSYYNLLKDGDKKQWDIKPLPKKLFDKIEEGQKKKRLQKAQVKAITDEQLQEKMSKLKSFNADALLEVVKPYWNEGLRHELNLYLTGYLRKQGVTQKDCASFCELIANSCNDDKNDLQSRLRAVETTYEQLLDNIKGYQGIEELEPDLAEELQLNANKIFEVEDDEPISTDVGVDDEPVKPVKRTELNIIDYQATSPSTKKDASFLAVCACKPTNNERVTLYHGRIKDKALATGAKFCVPEKKRNVPIYEGNLYLYKEDVILSQRTDYKVYYYDDDNNCQSVPLGTFANNLSGGKYSSSINALLRELIKKGILKDGRDVRICDEAIYYSTDNNKLTCNDYRYKAWTKDIEDKKRTIEKDCYDALTLLNKIINEAISKELREIWFNCLLWALRANFKWALHSFQKDYLYRNKGEALAQTLLIPALHVWGAGRKAKSVMAELYEKIFMGSHDSFESKAQLASSVNKATCFLRADENDMFAKSSSKNEEKKNAMMALFKKVIEIGCIVHNPHRGNTGKRAEYRAYRTFLFTSNKAPDILTDTSVGRRMIVYQVPNKLTLQTKSQEQLYTNCTCDLVNGGVYKLGNTLIFALLHLFETDPKSWKQYYETESNPIDNQYQHNYKCGNHLLDILENIARKHDKNFSFTRQKILEDTYVKHSAESVCDEIKGKLIEYVIAQYKNMDSRDSNNLSSSYAHGGTGNDKRSVWLKMLKELNIAARYDIAFVQKRTDEAIVIKQGLFNNLLKNADQYAQDNIVNIFGGQIEFFEHSTRQVPDSHNSYIPKKFVNFYEMKLDDLYPTN